MPLHPKVLLQGDTPSAYSSFLFKIWDEVKKQNSDFYTPSGYDKVNPLITYTPLYYAAHIQSYNGTECKLPMNCSGSAFKAPGGNNPREYLMAISVDEASDPINWEMLASRFKSMLDFSMYKFEMFSNIEQHPKLYLIGFGEMLTAGRNGYGSFQTGGDFYSLDSSHINIISDCLFSNIPGYVDHENDGYTYGIWNDCPAGMPAPLIWNYK